ncbi:histidine kinase [bacterium]|nr:histidine kinase [bacterium]
MSYQIKKWLILFGICTFVGLFSFSAYQASFLMEQESVPAVVILINEFTGSYSYFLLLPFILFFIERMRFSRTNWYWMVPSHIVFTMMSSVTHTMLMTVSRVWLYNKFDFGTYDLGEPYYRFVMEYHKQFLIYCSVVVAVYVVDYYRKNREREKKAAELQLTAAQLQSQLVQAQLQSLKGQLQPHFLFNTLNMISSFMYEDVKKADKMMAQLSTMLRMLLEHSDWQEVTLKHELVFLNLYLDIMRARFEDKLKTDIQLGAGLELAIVPNLILQPLVENAIKHNDFERSDITAVRIRIYKENSFLFLFVSDNGPGFNGNVASLLEKGIGLSNMKERLFRLYGEEHQLEFSKSQDGGLQIMIKIPYKTAAQKQ